MPKFTLIGEHTDLQQNPDGSKVTYEFHCDYLPEVLEHLELFIRGLGFVPNGTLDFVPDHEYYGEPEFTGDGHDGMGTTLEDWRQNDGAGTNTKFGGAGNVHSQYYFDKERNR